MTVINNRVDWIDSLRGYVMFLVVLGHNDNLPEIITTWIYSFHVPCFFIISGFFLNKWFYERAFFPKLISLSKKLLVPYLLYGFILTCFLALKEDNYLEALMNFSISLFYGNGNHWPVWFISALFTAQLFFYFFKKWKISLLLLGVLCVVAFLITELCNWKNLPWEMDLVPVVGIFILGGNFLYTRILSKVDKCGMVWYGMVIISIVLGSCAALLNGRVDMNSRCYGNIMLYFTSSFFCLLHLLYSLCILKISTS